MSRVRPRAKPNPRNWCLTPAVSDTFNPNQVREFPLYPDRMDELGLFPLPVVLFPTERIPLHIFEPRYLELIEDCLANGREFGFVFAADESLQQVGTRAVVAEIMERLEDGRMNIVVEG